MRRDADVGQRWSAAQRRAAASLQDQNLQTGKLVFSVAALVQEPPVEDSEGQSGRLNLLYLILLTPFTFNIVFLVLQLILDNT